MATVFIPVPWRDLTGGISQVEIPGASVAEVVSQLEMRFPGLKSRICVGSELAPALQVSIDDQMSRRGMRATLQPHSELHFLPAIGGG